MSKLRVPTATFYTKEEEVRSGYLYKSPPPGPLISMKSQKSWKRRFFRLLKMSEGVYTLKYFRSEETEKVLGEIDMSEISLLLFCPESHSMWGWIHKSFRCPASCVLLLRATNRDYFLVGENSWETNGWFDALYNILKGHEDMRYDQDMDVGKPRTRSAPPAPQIDHTHQASDREAKSKSMEWPPLSQPVITNPVCLLPPYPPTAQASLFEDTGTSATEEPIYAVPTSLPIKATKKALQDVDVVPKKTQSEPPASWTNKKTDLASDGKARPMSMPLSPPSLLPSLPRDTNPASLHLFAVPEDWPLAPPQVPKIDENEEGADCGVYEDMATLLNTEMMAEDKEPSEDIGDARTKSSPSVKDAMADEERASGHRLSTLIELEVCVSREDLKKHLDPTLDVETPGKRDSLLLKGDEILAINNLHIDSEEEVEFYLTKLRVNEVTLTIRRLSSEFQAMKAELSSM
ncbi:pleckstrin homology domain-containing family S member 1-like [Alosa sapidissima]|uniref:pleckstrin homology domain-containing family S member 1-like n=1 Tax=Alosa sapidissima TaxID=34773 RepID=UPI001C08A8A6|nr:pleckstrin homology domain-containing family S member 1-like [Alosa sapidissima]